MVLLVSGGIMQCPMLCYHFLLLIKTQINSSAISMINTCQYRCYYARVFVTAYTVGLNSICPKVCFCQHKYL